MKLLKDEGIAALEFALILPILILILFGTFEISRYAYLYQKIQQGTVGINQITGMNQLRVCDLQSLLNNAGMFFQPFDINANGSIIATGVSNNGTKTLVTWQQFSPKAATSAIGLVGATAKLPTGFTIASGDSAIFVEVFYTYTPLFNTIFTGPQQVYRMAVTKPRTGSAATLAACP
ncbi:TadE/TadG family type IV pilus assembly protein [Candidatus Bealeia paramacronuclearis]